jgi:hypothetical protein
MGGYNTLDFWGLNGHLSDRSQCIVVYSLETLFDANLSQAGEDSKRTRPIEPGTGSRVSYV